MMRLFTPHYIAAVVVVLFGYGVPAHAVTSFDVYGNWCGPKHPQDGQFPIAIDRLDAACKAHDECYSENGYFDCDCDRKLVEQFHSIIEDSSTTKTQLTYANRMLEYFTKYHACRGISPATSNIIQEQLKKSLGVDGEKNGLSVGIDDKGLELNYGKNHTDAQAQLSPDIVDARKSDLGLALGETVSINKWIIGTQGNKAAHPGISFDTQAFVSSTTRFEITHKGKPVFKISKMIPINGQHRQALAVEVRNNGDVASGYDRLRGAAYLSGLGLKLAAEEDGFAAKAANVLFSTEVNYELSHGFGNGLAQQNVAFIGPGAIIQNRTISGNITDLPKGQKVSFHTQFEDLSIRVDASNFIADPSVSRNWGVPVGWFRSEYRRPTDQSENLVDYYSCPTCTGGSKYLVYDTDYNAEGITAGVYFNERPENGSEGKILNFSFQYSHGLNNSVTLHGSNISLGGAHDIKYSGVDMNFGVGHVWKPWANNVEVEGVVGVGMLSRQWDNGSNNPLANRNFNDIDNMLSLSAELVFRF